MEKIIHRQTGSISLFDINKLCSIDTDIIDSPTKPLIHQTARFLFIQEGRAVIRIQGCDYEIYKQCVVLIFPWEISEVTVVDEALQYSIVKYKSDVLNLLATTLGLADQNGENVFLNLGKKHIVSMQAAEWEKMMKVIQQLEEELGLESVNVKETPESYSDVLSVTLLVNLVIQLDRASSGSETGGETDAFDKSEILRYIYLNLGEKLSIQRLAKKFYISQSSVRRYIFDMTGLTFNELVNEMRIGKTTNYLLYTDFTIEELADILGYVDASHISKIFQARVGMKINEYRKCYQKIQLICHIPESRINYSIINYIAKNYFQHITAQSVADMFGVSVPKLNQILIYQMGTGFSEFLDSVRINNACKMLLETKRSVTDIAYSVGYSTLKTFNRKFTNKKLMTPSQFRRTVHIQENM